MRIGKLSVDVVILTYGDYTGLERTISSLLSQTQTIGTVLLSDDGSGKTFPREALARLNKGNFRLVVRQGERNLGTVAHMNATATCTNGDILKFLAAGDAFSDCKALQTLVDFANQQDGYVVTSDCVVCNADLSRRYYRFPGSRHARRLVNRGERLFAALAVANCVSATGTIFRRDFFSERGGFDENYQLLEDWPTWLRLSREGYQIPYIPKVTALYAMGGVSSKDDNAYHAPRLREDMRRCYEKEILPYLEQMPKRARRVVEYRYASLTDVPEGELWRKYPLLCAKEAVKRRIKRCMTGS